MPGVLELVTAPTTYPVTAAQAILAGRIGGDVDEDEITRLIAAATEKVQNDTGRQLLESVWILLLDCFPCGREPIRITKIPFVAVTAISYVAPDDDAFDSTMSIGSVVYNSTNDNVGKIYPPVGELWPQTRSDYPGEKVSLTLTLGNDSADNVPAPLKQAIIMLVAHWYEHPEAVIGGLVTEVPLGYEALITPYKIMEYV